MNFLISQINSMIGLSKFNYQFPGPRTKASRRKLNRLLRKLLQELKKRKTLDGLNIKFPDLPLEYKQTTLPFEMKVEVKKPETTEINSKDNTKQLTLFDFVK
jgi:hypothetical protein